MKHFITFLSFVALFLTSWSQDHSVFSLEGSTHGFADGAIIIMSIGDEKADSAVVRDNRFSFQFSLDQSPLRAILHTRDFSEYRFLWLENQPMTFDASQSDFRNAPVTGSETDKLYQELHAKIKNNVTRSRKKIEMEFVAQHPNSVISAHLLAVYSTSWGKEAVSELYEALSPEIKNTENGQSVARYIELNQNPAIGDTFVDFEMETVGGSTAKLSDYKGNIILLEFWASSCGPCREENPNLVKTYQRYHPLGFEIFAVSQDTKKEYWLKAIEKDGLPWIQVSDLKGQANQAALIYGISFIPANFLIDREGTIIATNLRGAALDRKLNKLFASESK